MTGLATLPPAEKAAKKKQHDERAAVSRCSINSVDLARRKLALDAYEERKLNKE